MASYPASPAPLQASASDCVVLCVIWHGVLLAEAPGGRGKRLVRHLELSRLDLVHFRECLHEGLTPLRPSEFGSGQSECRHLAHGPTKTVHFHKLPADAGGGFTPSSDRIWLLRVGGR